MSRPGNLEIDRLTLHLPSGRVAQARAIALEIGMALAGAEMSRTQGMERLELVVNGNAPPRAIGQQVAWAAALQAAHPKGRTGNGC